jgi:hypothetical protein
VYSDFIKNLELGFKPGIPYRKTNLQLCIQTINSGILSSGNRKSRGKKEILRFSASIGRSGAPHHLSFFFSAAAEQIIGRKKKVGPG